MIIKAIKVFGYLNSQSFVSSAKLFAFRYKYANQMSKVALRKSINDVNCMTCRSYSSEEI